MTFPLTGIVFLYGAIILFYLSHRSIEIYRTQKNPTGRLFGTFFGLFGIGTFFLGFSYLFLVQNTIFWSILGRLFGSFNIAAFSVLGITLCNLDFIKPKKIAIITFIFFGVVASVLSPPPPHVYQSGSVTWQEETLTPLGIVGKILFFALALGAVFPTALYFFFWTKKKKRDRIKRKVVSWTIALILATIVLVIMALHLFSISVNPRLTDLFFFLFFSSLLLIFFKKKEKHKV